eukprot:4319927-Prorocentrum_lima.AAC.1
MAPGWMPLAPPLLRLLVPRWVSLTLPLSLLIPHLLPSLVSIHSRRLKSKAGSHYALALFRRR